MNNYFSIISIIIISYYWMRPKYARCYPPWFHWCRLITSSSINFIIRPIICMPNPIIYYKNYQLLLLYDSFKIFPRQAFFLYKVPASKTFAFCSTVSGCEEMFFFSSRYYLYSIKWHFCIFLFCGIRSIRNDKIFLLNHHIHSNNTFYL